MSILSGNCNMYFIRLTSFLTAISERRIAEHVQRRGGRNELSGSEDERLSPILSHAAVKQEPDILQIFFRNSSITLGVEHTCKQLESPNPLVLCSQFSRHTRIKSIFYTYFLLSPLFVFFLCCLEDLPKAETFQKLSLPKLRQLAKHTYRGARMLQHEAEKMRLWHNR